MMAIVFYLVIGVFVAGVTIDAARQKLLQGNQWRNRQVNEEVTRELCDLSQETTC